MLTIYAVSDSIGETAELVARASAYQFHNNVTVKRVSYIKSLEAVDLFINSLAIGDSNNTIMIVSTIILPDVGQFLTQRCVEKRIPINNILGPVISVASSLLKKMPDYNPGAVWKLDQNYYKKIEAMEFAIQYDDSKDHSGIKHADVILVGLSRTSKTPICLYLANKGIKALNIPLIPEIPVPEELFEVDRRKIIALTINPLELIEIRKHRLDKYTLAVSKNDYADEGRILDELEYSDKVFKRLRCKTINVTDRAIEDTALLIMNHLQQ
ncbi:MAG: pyruvate, water dikinase regulatory protein [Clostridium sp.]